MSGTAVEPTPGDPEVKPVAGVVYCEANPFALQIIELLLDLLASHQMVDRGCQQIDVKPVR